jgi:hypothetical protein
MPKLVGPLKLSGTIGDLNFYSNPDGTNVVRNKANVSERNIALATRQNYIEFCAASELAGKLRQAFRQHLEYLSEGSYFNRLVGLSNMVCKTDPAATRGHRRPANGNIYLLEGFEWNAKLHFDKAFHADYTAYIDPFTGKMHLDINSFIPGRDMKVPAAASHFQIIARGVAIHPEESNSRPAVAVTGLITLDGIPTDPVTLALEVDKGVEEGMFAFAVGIIFFEEVAEVPLALKQAGPLTILSIEKINHEEQAIGIDDETGEVTGKDPAEMLKDHKAKQAIAMEGFLKMMEAAAQKQHLNYSPVTNDSEQQMSLGDKRLALQKQLWVKKLNKYRKG